MKNDLDEKERSTWQERYSYCKDLEVKEDLVFVYPGNFKGEAATVTDRLQEAMDFLKYVSDSNPTQEFHSRTIIGYRHRDDEGGKECSPGWLPNWINIPWNYLYKPPEQNEPLDVCSHEVVHPFYRISPLHTASMSWGGNEGWGEGFCDFLRGPVKNVMGLDGRAWWWQMIEAQEKGKDGLHWNPAGQLIKMALNKYWNPNEVNEFVEWFIDDKDGLRDLVSFLFKEFADRPLSDVLTATKEMEKQYRDKEMI